MKKAFTIDAARNITAFTSKTQAQAAASGVERVLVFSTEGELAKLGFSGANLVEIWNDLPGVTPVKKFTNSAVACKRILKQLQSLETEADVAAKPAKGRSKGKGSGRKPKAAAAGAEGGASKQDLVIAMLKKPGGAAIEAIMGATGWQRHTVRGFMAGALKTKLGLAVKSDRVEGVRTYSL